MEIFAKRLKKLRTENSLTQTELAKKLHLRQQSYLRYEQDSGEPSLETLAKLAKFFDVTVDYLLGLKEDYNG